MSFILEALRKSEHQRQRETGPGIAELPVARPPSRTPVALVVIGALLAVNLALLLHFLLREPAPTVERAAPQPATEAAVPATVPGAAATSDTPAAVPRPLPEPPRSRREVEAIPPPEPTREIRPLAVEAAAGDEPALTGAFDPPEPPDPSLLPAAPVARVTMAPATATAPRIDTLPPETTAGLPPLNLDLHIYATDAGKRAAFINGRRYREGDSLPEGARLEAITPDGAVLSFRGQRFLLPRQ